MADIDLVNIAGAAGGCRVAARGVEPANAAGRRTRIALIAQPEGRAGVFAATGLG
jgi:hypothetical protein